MTTPTDDVQITPIELRFPDTREVPAFGETALSQLIDMRRRELDLRPSELVTRFGWRNMNSGMTALAHVKFGVIHEMIERNGAAALEMPEDAFATAIAATREQVVAAERARQAAVDRQYEAQFTPFILVKGERFPRAVCNLMSCIANPWGPAKVSLPRDVARIPNRMWTHYALSGGEIPMWGQITGYFHVYAPGKAVEYTVMGERIGEAEVPRV